MAITELQSSDSQVVCLADAINEPYENSNRRGHMRLGADDLRWLRSARVKYGPDVRVIDLSIGGILVETESQLRPNSNVVFELSGPVSPILIPSRVLRCRVASFDEVMRYQGACAFKRPLQLPELVQQMMAMGMSPEPIVAAKTASANWQRVIARYRDGRLVRGYTADFHPSKPQLHLSAEPHTSDAVFLQLSQLKALFFVRDFAGDQLRIDSQEFSSATQGRRIAVTFHDGEVLVGSTLGYRGKDAGFFVHPADPRSNNLRVFVAPRSTSEVKFL